MTSDRSHFVPQDIEEKVPPLLEQGGYSPLADGRVREDMSHENVVRYRRLLEELTQGEARERVLDSSEENDKEGDMVSQSGSKKTETLFVSPYDSPLGRYLLVTSDKGIVCLEPEEHAVSRISRWREEGVSMREGSGLGHRAVRELKDYFAGRLKKFTLPLDLRGTSFQKSVWEALLRIPYGETRSYSDIAQAIGKPGAARAVGLANGANPVSIVVPCHRVIGKSGDLVGYGGGLERKRALLELEARA